MSEYVIKRFTLKCGKRSAHRPTLHRLETEADYDFLIGHMTQIMNRVKDEPEIGRKLLVGTGMYDKNGQLKDEFA